MFNSFLWQINQKKDELMCLETIGDERQIMLRFLEHN